MSDGTTRRVVVLGAGMIGSAIARDLAMDSGLRVDVADVRPEALERAVAGARARAVKADLGDTDAVRRLVNGSDLVVGALPSVIGRQTVRAVVEAGRDMVDISFMPQSALDLDGRARERKAVMRVRAEGHEAGKPSRYLWDLVDRFDETTGLRSMSRSTGFTATAVARLVLDGTFRRPGVHSPRRPWAPSPAFSTVCSPTCGPAACAVGPPSRRSRTDEPSRRDAAASRPDLDRAHSRFDDVAHPSRDSFRVPSRRPRTPSGATPPMEPDAPVRPGRAAVKEEPS